jgi:drug/metabolite transporter (DMT)-like permease
VNEEMQSKVVQYLQGMESRLGKAEGFVIEQAPLYVQELLMWHFWSNMLGAAVLLLIAAVIAGIFAYAVRIDDEALPAAVLFGIPVCFCFLFGSGLFVTESIKSQIAPRLVVVEHIKGQMK